MVQTNKNEPSGIQEWLAGSKRWLMGSTAAMSAAAVAIFSPNTVESLVKHLSDASQNQFSRDVFIFSLAAIIHSGRMKKEIRSNFETLIMSIDSVSAALREDLKKHGDRLDGLTSRVDALELTNPRKETKI